MLKNQDIICISSIDWDFIWQGHQEIMSTLAKNGNRVLFIENTGVRAPRVRDFPRLRKRFKDYFRGVKGIRKEVDNLYIFSPIVLPFPYSRMARFINKFLLLSVLNRWARAMGFLNPVIWTFLPTGITLDIINNVNKKLLIYYCIDNFAVSSASAKKIRNTEQKVLKAADLVFVTSKALYDYCEQYSDRVDIFPFGVNVDNFEKARVSAAEAPEELKDIKKPVIGYVGGVHKWIDQNLVKTLAANRPDYSFVFVGPLQTDVSSLSEMKNIYFLGSKKHHQLPFLVKYFSVAIIPYLITDYTKNVYPTKLNEYLAMGKPVVSTALPEIEMFNEKYDNIVRIGNNYEKFAEGIEKALQENDETRREKYIEAAKDNGWLSRIERMSAIIEKAIERKMLENEAGWQEKLIVFYRVTRSKITRFAAIAASAYLLVFYTPLAWFLAEPLKIQDAPSKADAIVTFAGGVGESGKAGQGYEERVKYAVDLYKQGYADHLIFSSGYMYVFKEPLVMKALAISLGVPEKAIILEDRAGNTYENIKFTSKILEENSWHKILLVSAPYHMRRVSLVFDKAAKDIKVLYTPMPNGSFYAHKIKDIYSGWSWQQVTLKQIKGIIHEYAGIIYYRWKGYIY
ncbi:MAG: ElyC/SanA/YdcF family protein [Candidatus Omnitrophota bacterium]